jgi:cell fate (sporulation/competence/biofilm development) regulator YlbF (YheA/YmcA/DUF963 family)
MMESIMELNADTSPIVLKTRELCQAILDQPDFRSIRERIDAFMADENVKGQYRDLSEKGAVLQHKQQTGMMVNHDELTAFDQQRQAFLNNPVAQGFMDAQQTVFQVQESVSNYVTKTFELGRLPIPEDFGDGNCGHGCGCQH